jgi:hypothetical protein
MIEPLEGALVATIKANLQAEPSDKLRKILSSDKNDEWSPEAIEAARQILIERSEGRLPEPAHGTPILGDGLSTSDSAAVKRKKVESARWWMAGSWGFVFGAGFGYAVALRIAELWEFTDQEWPSVLAAVSAGILGLVLFGQADKWVSAGIPRFVRAVREYRWQSLAIGTLVTVALVQLVLLANPEGGMVWIVGGFYLQLFLAPVAGLFNPKSFFFAAILAVLLFIPGHLLVPYIGIHLAYSVSGLTIWLGSWVLCRLPIYDAEPS